MRLQLSGVEAGIALGGVGRIVGVLQRLIQRGERIGIGHIAGGCLRAGLAIGYGGGELLLSIRVLLGRYLALGQCHGLARLAAVGMPPEQAGDNQRYHGDYCYGNADDFAGVLFAATAVTRLGAIGIVLIGDLIQRNGGRHHSRLSLCRSSQGGRLEHLCGCGIIGRRYLRCRHGNGLTGYGG